MRYEWGLGVGHTYAHKDAKAANLQVQLAYGSSQDGLGQRLEPRCNTRKDSPEPDDRGEGVDGGDRGEGEGPDGVEGQLGSAGQQDDDEDDDDEDGTDSESSEYDSDDDDGCSVHAPGYDSEAEKEYMLFGRGDY